MKKIHLSHICQHYTRKNRKGNYKYQVYLGNGTHHTFESKRDALAFLNKTSQFLTQKLYELRGLYANVIIEYNKQWGKIETLDCYNITTELSYFEQQTQQITGPYLNQNFKSFMFLSNGCNSLVKIIKVLQAIAKKNSDTASLYQLDNFIRYNNNIKFEIESYGTIEAVQLFKVPIHEVLTSKQEYEPKLKIV